MVPCLCSPHRRDPDGVSVGSLSALFVRFLSTERRITGVASVAMRLVGLTGGIGSGKSTVADLLRAKGQPWSTPTRSRAPWSSPGSRRCSALVERFGAGILDADGRLDRPALAAVAFADDDGRKALGDITWPAIGEEFERRIKEAPPDRGSRLRHPPGGEQGRSGGPTWRSSWWRPADRAPRSPPRSGAWLATTPSAGWRRRRPTKSAGTVATHVVDNGGGLESLARQVGTICG